MRDGARSAAVAPGGAEGSRVANDTAPWFADAGDGGSPPASRGSVDLAGLYALDFDGASGRVVFDPRTGSRDPASASYVLENVRPNEDGTADVVTVATLVDGRVGKG